MIINAPDDVMSRALYLFKAENNTKHKFHMLRDAYNQSQDKDERAIIFLYLNRHCFNSLMRYNSSGEFNTSFGRYKKPAINEDDVKVFSHKFKRARFVSGSFETLKFNRTEGTTVFCDPPYILLSKTASFASYTKAGFNLPHHQALDKKCAYWAKGGCDVFVSNHDVPLIGECYPKHKEKRTFLVSRTISQKITQRKPVKEVLLHY